MDSRILHYEFVTGESVNITVSAEIAEVIYDSRRMEHASNERSRYHTALPAERNPRCCCAACKSKSTTHFCVVLFLVEITGIEPVTSCMPCKRSPS